MSWVCVGVVREAGGGREPVRVHEHCARWIAVRHMGMLSATDPDWSWAVAHNSWSQVHAAVTILMSPHAMGQLEAVAASGATQAWWDGSAVRRVSSEE